MSNKPKQWGPHASPEGLGKLRTAIATLPGQSHVSVSGPGFTGKKAGDYREVTSFDPEVPPKALPPDELFSTGGDVPFGPPVTKGSPLDAKGFHKVKGSYGMQIARSVFYLDTSPPTVANMYQQNYIDRSGRNAEYRFWYHPLPDLYNRHPGAGEIGVVSNNYIGGFSRITRYEGKVGEPHPYNPIQPWRVDETFTTGGETQ